MTLPLILSFCCLTSGDVSFERIVIDADFPSCYQVEAVDVNGDGKPDVVALGGGTVAWYENPSWKKRVVSTPKHTPGVISSATADIDGDGKSEIVIAYDFEMNEPKRGKLVLARQGKSLDDPWKLEPIGAQPSTHRLRFAAFDSKHVPKLLIASPIFGAKCLPPKFDQDLAKIEAFTIDPKVDPSQWPREIIAERPVIHSLEVLEVADDSRVESPVILTADNLGTALVARPKPRAGDPSRWTVSQLADGSDGDAPKRGSSEVHLGRLFDGGRFLATINPWHGNQVSVRYSEGNTPSNDLTSLRFGPRVVLDSTLDDGHALCLADVDRDGTDEIFAGHRGKDSRLSMFHYDRASKTWTRTVLDRSIAPQDSRSADFNADGLPDVVSAGGKTHNVVLYRFKKHNHP